MFDLTLPRMGPARWAGAGFLVILCIAGACSAPVSGDDADTVPPGRSDTTTDNTSTLAGENEVGTVPPAPSETTTDNTTTPLEESPVTDTSVAEREGFRDAIQGFVACVRETLPVKLTAADADVITLSAPDADVASEAETSPCIDVHLGRYEGVLVRVVVVREDIPEPPPTTTLPPSGTVELDWAECVMTGIAEYAVGPGWLDWIDGMAEFSPQDVAAILDRNERNEWGSIVATVEDGTALPLLGSDPAAIHTAFDPRIEARLYGAVERDAVVWSWLFDVPLDGLHSLDVFLPDGSRVDINGCANPVTASVDEFAATQRPDSTDYEVWLAVLTDPAEQEAYVDWYEALLAG